MEAEGEAPGEVSGMMSIVSELTNSMPGWDEVMGFMTIIKTVKSSTYDVVVFDTAPTGHTLRLLSMPQVSWACQHFSQYYYYSVACF